MAGTVKDSAAAVVPEVKVTVRNNATNASRSALTDRSGSYRIASLGPGSYDVVIEKLGFKIVEYPRVELTVDQVQSLDAILTPSAITEKVTVQGETVAPIDLPVDIAFPRRDPGQFPAARTFREWFPRAK